MSALEDCRAALQSPNVTAFLRLIRAGESSQTDRAYRTMFGGSTFDDFDDHPRITNRAVGLASTAAGAYQFLSKTWDECRDALGLLDFSPGAQDLAAVYLVRRRGALADVLAGRIEQAITKCNREWASLPGSPYGQPVITLDRALSVYSQFGGQFSTASVPDLAEPTPQPSPPAAPPPAPKGPPVAPFLLAALPALLEMIPKLGKVFGSGSAVAERNVAAATIVADVVQQVTGARNIQEAVETMKSDPAALAAATQAIETRWYEIAEAGGGGIDGARKAEAAAVDAGRRPWQSASMWALLLLLPLAYMVVGSVVGLWGANDWSPDVRAAISTAVVSLIIGGAAGYYWGATTTRNTSTSRQ